MQEYNQITSVDWNKLFPGWEEKKAAAEAMRDRRGPRPDGKAPKGRGKGPKPGKKPAKKK